MGGGVLSTLRFLLKYLYSVTSKIYSVTSKIFDEVIVDFGISGIELVTFKAIEIEAATREKASEGIDETGLSALLVSISNKLFLGTLIMS